MDFKIMNYIVTLAKTFYGVDQNKKNVIYAYF